jgi:O-antigen biosynthesis protein
MSVPPMGEDPAEIEQLRTSLRASRLQVEQLENALSETHTRHVHLVHRNNELEARIGTYENSRTVVLATRAVQITAALVPAGSTRRRVAGATVRAGRGYWNRLRGLPPAPGTAAPRLRDEAEARRDYIAWLAHRSPTQGDLARQRATSGAWTLRPLISVCMPVYNPDPEWLAQAIESVQSQSYDHWELCICDDASTRQGVREVLDDMARQDPRIKVDCRVTNGGISNATNGALALAQGEFVAFLDDDDFIEPHTLYLVVKELQTDAEIDLFYCDEDVLLPSGERADPYLKPGWSPEALLSMNYITHFVVARHRLVTEIGGMRPERDGGQDHDLVLRLSEHTTAICHVPEVLYTWRQSPGSTSMTPDAKRWAFDASVEAVRDALERRHISGRVDPGSFPGAARVRYALPRPTPHVEILVPTRDRLDQLGPCIESVMATTRQGDFSITIIDNDSRDTETLEFLRTSGLKVIAAPGPFNYSTIINRGFDDTESEYIVTLNNDTRIVDPDWLEGLLELGARPDVGAVGCSLVFPDGRLQHQGVVIGCGVPAANLSFDNPFIRIGSLLNSTRDVTAVTGACCLIRRSAWERVGGLDESFAVAYNDVDFCLRLRAAHYRVLYTPHVTVVHDESASRGALHPDADERLLREKWGIDGTVGGDPFFSPLLELGEQGWRLAPGRPTS